jgi:hypothetical protein
MAKGQKRSIREIRKPKANPAKKTNASNPTLKGVVQVKGRSSIGEPS